MPSACPNCGRGIEGREEFCNGCGAFLGWEDKGLAESQLLPPPAPQDDQRAAVQLQMKSDVIKVAPGSSESTTCIVKNLGTKVEEFRFVVAGPDWIIVEPAVLSVYPGQESTGVLQAAPPRSPSSIAGVTPFQVTVTSTVHRRVSSTVAGRADVAPYYELVAELVPTSSSGRGLTRHHIRLGNRGNTALRVGLSPTDVADGLRLDTPAVADVAPGTITEVPVSVYARRRWFGRPEPKTFSVIADAPKPVPAARLPGTRTVVPLFPRWVPVAAAALLAAGVASAAVIPKLTHKSPGPTTSTSTSTSTSASTSASASASASASTPPPPPVAPYDLTSNVMSATWTTVSPAGTLATTVQPGNGCQVGTSGAVFTLMQVPLQNGTTVPTALETIPPGHESASIGGVYMLQNPTVAGEVFRANVGFCQGVGAGSLEQYSVVVGSQQQQVASGTLDSNTGSLAQVDANLPVGTTQIELRVMNVVASNSEGDVVWVDPIVEPANAASTSP
jgi:hypothetical protein